MDGGAMQGAAWLWPVFGALLGLALGSFVNSLAWGLAGGPMPWRRRSQCPLCGARLAWLELVPLMSYARQGGRCRHCQGAISPLYPLGEAAGGLLVGLWLWAAGPGLWAAVGAGFSLALLLLALVDARVGVLPDVVVWPALGAALALAPWRPDLDLGQAALGAALAGGGLWAVAALHRLLRGRDGLGLGDVKLAALLGALLGWPLAGVAVAAAAGAGTLFYLARYGLGRMAWQDPVPFGPFLALGGALTGLALA